MYSVWRSSDAFNELQPTRVLTEVIGYLTLSVIESVQVHLVFLISFAELLEQFVVVLGFVDHGLLAFFEIVQLEVRKGRPNQDSDLALLWGLSTGCWVSAIYIQSPDTFNRIFIKRVCLIFVRAFFN